MFEASTIAAIAAMKGHSRVRPVAVPRSDTGLDDRFGKDRHGRPVQPGDVHPLSPTM